MIRKGFVLKVNPGCADEYARRHQPIWDELTAVLRAHGARNYSIFWHPDTDQLFGYVEVENEERWESIAETEVCRRWWAYMADIMETNADHSPRTRTLNEVFHMD